MFGTGKGIRNEGARLKGAATTIRTVTANPREHGLDDKKVRILNEAASILVCLGANKGREAKAVIREEKERERFLERASFEAHKLIEQWPAGTVAERTALIEHEPYQCIKERDIDTGRLLDRVDDYSVGCAQKDIARHAAWEAWERKIPVQEAVMLEREKFDLRLTNPSPTARNLIQRIEAMWRPA